MQHPRAYWVDWFASRPLPFAPVKDLKEAMEDEHLAARNMILRDAQGHRHLGVPIRFRDEPARPNLTIPTCGEHTDAIFGEI